MKRLIVVLIITLAVLAGCASRREPISSSHKSSSSTIPFVGPTPEEYIRQVVVETVQKFEKPGMSEYEKVKAAFDYLIETGYYTWPPALDIWRIRCGEGEMPSFVENRSLSMLLYGAGTCEDYAAALVMMLESMDIEAQYIPGLTYSRDGYLVHHAWTAAKVDGIWYHLDCQLEDNISNGTVKYKYFMKSDTTMLASHRWGQNLINSGLLEADQNEEIAREYINEACPQDYPTPEVKQIAVTPEIDCEALFIKMQIEYAKYQKEHGKLKYIELNVLPPVFGRYGGFDELNGITEWYKYAYTNNALIGQMLIQS